MGASAESSTGLLGVQLPLGDGLVARIHDVVGARLFGTQPPRFGRYELIRTLGEGGGGAVHLALDPTLDRQVALKLLHTGASSDGAQERLVREARLLAGVDHPNIVEVYDVGVVDGRVYVVTEFVAGGDLAQWLGRRRREVSEILAAFIAAARGLSAAHAAGVIHRDFKPSNVLVTLEEVVKVADFGLARGEGGAETLPAPVSVDRPTTAPRPLALQRTRSGLVMGTAPYMAPEQHQARPTDARTDVFAFCVSLFEALYGRRPFVGGDLPSLERAKREGRIVTTTPAEGVPARIERAIRIGLRPDPDARWQSMEELVAELEHRPRRWLSIGAVAAVAAIGIAAAASRPAAGGVCTDGMAPAPQQAVSSVRASVSAGAAGDIASDRLEAHADRWQRSWALSCRLHAIDDRADRLSDRTACLQRAAGTLETLAHAMEGADPARLSRAAEALVELPPPERCLSPADADADAPEVPDATPGAVLAAVERSQVLETVGDYEAAHRAAREAVVLATQSHAKSGLPAAQLWYGKVSAHQGDYVGAAAELERAYWLAAQHDDALQARIAAELFRIHVLGLGDADGAASWRRHAEAALERSDDESARYWLHVVSAHQALFVGDDATALREAELALDGEELRRRHKKSKAVLVRADALLRLQRHEEAIDALQAQLDTQLDRLGESHPSTAATMITLGRALSVAGRNDDAVELLRRAIALVDASQAPTSPTRVTARHALVTPLLNKADDTAAAEVLEDAIDVGERIYGPDNIELAGMHSNLGLTLARLGEIEAAEQHLYRALAVFDAALGTGHRNSSFPIEGLAEVERARGDLVAAAERFEECARIRAEGFGPSHGLTLVCVANAGYTWTDVGRLDRAQQRFEDALEVGDMRPIDEAYVRLGFGAALRQAGDARRAVEELERSEALYAQLQASDREHETLQEELRAARAAVARKRHPR